MATPPVVETPVKTSEELAAEAKSYPQKEANELANLMLNGTGPRTRKPDGTFAPVAKEPEKPAAAAAPAKPAKKPAAKPAPVVAPKPDLEEVIARTSEAVGASVAAAMKPKETPAPAPTDETAFLTEDEREMLPVLERMEAMKPERYKGLKGKYVENLKAVAEYQANWEKENPGEAFDPEDKAHNDFFAKHEVGWNDLDERMAIGDMAADRRVAEERSKTGAKLTELEQREKMREIEPAAFSESKRAGRQLFALAGDAFKDIINDQGQVNAEAIAKLRAEDPLAAEIVLDGEAVMFEAHAKELYRLMNDAVPFNKANPMHNFLLDFATRQENEILALPKADQVNGEGKKFATTKDFGTMPAAKRANYYTLTVTDLNNLLAAERSAFALKKLDTDRKRFEALAPKYGYTKANGGNEPARPAAAARVAATDDAPVQVESGRAAIPAGGGKRTDVMPKKAESGFVRSILGL